MHYPIRPPLRGEVVGHPRVRVVMFNTVGYLSARESLWAGDEYWLEHDEAKRLIEQGLAREVKEVS